MTFYFNINSHITKILAIFSSKVTILCKKHEINDINTNNNKMLRLTSINTIKRTVENNNLEPKCTWSCQQYKIVLGIIFWKTTHTHTHTHACTQTTNTIYFTTTLWAKVILLCQNNKETSSHKLSTMGVNT